MEMKIMRHKLAKKRITKMLDEDNLTTGQIKEKLINAKTATGRPSVKGILTNNQLQMVLSQNYRKVSFCSKTRQVIWGNK